MPTTTPSNASTFLSSGKLAHFDPGKGVEAGAAAGDFDDTGWLEITIPGDVHRTLIDAGEIPDPFWDQQEKDCAWMEEKEWWYHVPLHVPDVELGQHERWQLVFHGLDTFVTIYLDGEEIGTSQNMFRDTVVDITEHVQAGREHTLALQFHPPLLAIEGRHLGEWAANGRERTAMRKAQFGYGWDWGPRLPTVGTWRPIELRRVDRGMILGIHFDNVDLSPDHTQAVVAVRVEAERVAGTDPLSARVTLREPASDREWTAELDLTESPAGHADGCAYLTIGNPKLWWTHDLGEPFLHDLTVELIAGDDVVVTDERKVGIRSLVLDQSPDLEEKGARFFRFVLNGVPIFAKGADWIPPDSFVGAIEDERYTRWLEDARDANIQMMRVWGGGIYEHDRFYDECDRVGILVWQDFMFACAAYPEDDPTFVQEVDREARYQVRRLRSHPSLAVWVGNNENQWINDKTYWNVEDPPPWGALYYNHILPDAVYELDGRTPYWPGSPYGGNDHNSMEDGNRHNWDVWHGQVSPRRFGEKPEQIFTPEMVSYRRYAEDMTRFCSEFGMHASPVIETLRRVVPEDELYHHSPAMDWHNKDNPKDKGDMLMAATTGVSENLEDYIDFSQIAQAEGLKFGIEHYRRRKPHCSGTLVWQMNDCWPVLSWAVMDYYGFGKAGYHYLRRVYSPVLASFKETDDGVELWITNDTLERIEDEVTITLGTFGGEVVEERQLYVDLPPNSSERVDVWPSDVIASNRYLRVESPGDRYPDNRHFFVDLKDLDRRPAEPKVEKRQVSDHELEVILTAPEDGYCWFVHLQRPVATTRYSDNYVDIARGRSKTIVVRDASSVVDPEEVTVAWR
ncbi:MAG TPA: glycoside hydrolase family 2 protein [Thermomicrobiales bacterium]|nr:glycoside hydrolase family 2 protein [Thermomicrobiales bacterium]